MYVRMYVAYVVYLRPYVRIEWSEGNIICFTDVLMVALLYALRERGGERGGGGGGGGGRLG